MKDEVVARLRERTIPVMAAAGQYEYEVNRRPDELCHQAADLIEQQALLIEELREGLAGFVAWRDRVQNGSSGCDYLNGDDDDGRDGWKDLDALADKARSQSRRG